MFKVRKDSVSHNLACTIQNYSGPTLGAKNVTQYYNITIILCLRYTEVDQTFGWARLAMSGSE